MKLDKNQKTSEEEEPAWVKEVDIEAMLNKYGPKSCYEIAKRLMDLAMIDGSKKGLISTRFIPAGSCQQPTCIYPFGDSCDGCFWFK